VATRQHRQGSTGKAAEARQGKARQHELRVQMTCSESGWYLAEAVGYRLRGCVVARP